MKHVDGVYDSYKGWFWVCIDCGKTGPTNRRRFFFQRSAVRDHKHHVKFCCSAINRMVDDILKGENPNA